MHATVKRYEGVDQPKITDGEVIVHKSGFVRA